MNGSKDKIIGALNGTDAIECLYAIRAYALSDDTDDRCVAALKRLKKDSAIWGIKLSDAAEAALDISGAEKYKGNNELIKELIETKFYTKKEDRNGKR